MTIDEAIEILGDLLTTLPQVPPEERIDAVNLGIEALKRIEKERVFHFSQGLIGINRLLPGETA